MRLKLSIFCVLAGLLLCASSALAGQARLFTGSFGGASSAVPDPYPLSERLSVAVDSSGGLSSGDVYVADPANYRVEKFDATGHFILMFGKDVNKSKVEEAGSTAVERDVCTALSGDVCQVGVASTEPGGFTDQFEGLYVAVDNSSGPSAGDVYVGETIMPPNSAVKGEGAGEGAVMKFDEEGRPVAGWGTEGELKTAGTTPLGAVGGVTVSGTGDVWVYGTGERERPEKTVSFEPIIVVHELKQDSTAVTEWTPKVVVPTGENLSRGLGIAVDGAGNVYIGSFPFTIYEYTASGEPVGRVSAENFGFGVAAGFAFDPSTNSLYQGVPNGYVSYGASCHDATFFFTGCVPGETFSSSHLAKQVEDVAVNSAGSSDTIYAAEGQGEVATLAIETLPDVATVPASGFTRTSATLNGTINPDGVALTECYFEWGETSAPYEHIAPCEAPGAAEIGAGSASVAVHAHITIQFGKSYHFRLVAANINQLFEPTRGADVVFGPPRVDSTSVSQITTESATFHVEINPRNLDTEYHFEYLTEAEYDENGESFSGPHPAISVPVPDWLLGAGEADLLATRHVDGLAVHTAYRYRVVAHSRLAEGVEAVDGPTQSFITLGTGAFGLPDGRQWEMVSPPNKEGALIEPIGEDWVIQASAEGGRLAYVARTATEADPQGALIYQSVLATRGSEGGWSSHDLSVPHAASTSLSVGQGWEYRFFSEDLSRAVVQPFGVFVPCVSAQGEAQPCLSPHASEQTAFLDSLYASEGSRESCSSSCFTPLVTGAEGYANVPPHTIFGQISIFGGSCPPVIMCGPQFLDATPDASHVVLKSRVALIPSPAAGKGIPPNSLYEWSEDDPASEQLRLVSVLPGNAKGEALPAEAPLIGLTSETANDRHAISGDGARVAWGSNGHLYLRENATQPQSPFGPSGECIEPADACTVQLDVGLSGQATFQTANAEVTRIFFTDGGDLYEYEVQSGKLVALTKGAGVPGAVVGASEDGSWIYYAGSGALAPGAVNGSCTAQKVETACNLYVSHFDSGGWEAPRLITVLSGEDESDWGGNLTGGLKQMTARVSPNGRWLAFMSQRRLTGYDNSDVTSGEPDQEVYEYDAQTESLTCASCNPSGSRPHGLASEQINSGSGGLAGGDDVLSGSVAASLPGWTTNNRNGAIYQSRFLSDSGRLFMDSADALVPKDINGTEDVYEYEPEGVGVGEHACESSSGSGSIVFKPARKTEVEGRDLQEGAGCVGLISSGESPQESAFLDASETGSEVFFLTTGKLSAEDVDSSYDVYDARECTQQSPCKPAPAARPPACTTEASCRPAPSPQPEIFGPSGSQTFSGPGNLAPTTPVAPVTNKAKPLTRKQRLGAALKACRRDRVKLKRKRCEKAAVNRYGAKAVSGVRRTSDVNRGRRAK